LNRKAGEYFHSLPLADILEKRQNKPQRQKIRPNSNTENGETSNETLFQNEQVGNIQTIEYSCRKIKHRHLIGLVDH